MSEERRIGAGAIEVDPRGRLLRVRAAGTPGGTAARGAHTVYTLFTPSSVPVLEVWPPWSEHVRCAVRWALVALGREHTGGELLVLWDPPPTPCPAPRPGECLAAALAVDDAVSGGHRTHRTGPHLVDRLLREPAQLRRFAAATGIDPPPY